MNHLTAYRVNLCFIFVGVIVTALTLATGGGTPFISIGVIAFNLGLAIRNKKVLNAALRAPIAAKPLAPARTVFDCTEYSDRLFEQKLVDAGIMKSDDMTKCDNDACINCHPDGFWCEPCKEFLPTRGMHKNVHGQRPSLPRPPKGSAGVAKAKSYWKCKNCQDVLAYDGVCERCNYDSDGGKRARVNGEWVDRPGTVPAHAHGRIDPADPRMVFWTWTDSDTGKTMAMKSLRTDYIVKNATMITGGAITAGSILATPETPKRPVMKGNRGRGRFITIEGQDIAVPPNVPSHAEAWPVYKGKECTAIEWRWSYDNVKVHIIRQVFSQDECTCIVNEIRVQQYREPVRTVRTGLCTVHPKPEPLKFDKPEFDYFPKDKRRRRAQLGYG